MVDVLDSCASNEDGARRGVGTRARDGFSSTRMFDHIDGQAALDAEAEGLASLGVPKTMSAADARAQQLRERNTKIGLRTKLTAYLALFSRNKEAGVPQH